MTRSVAHADVRRALLAEQVQELVAQPRHARQRDAVPPEDRRPRREMRPEQLVRRVDQVELHRSSARLRLAAGTRLDQLPQAAQVGLEDRAEDRRHDQRAEVGEDRGDERSSQRTIVVVPSAPGSRVITPSPLNVPSWRIANRSAARTR